MSENWQPGDQALCICDKWGERGPARPLPKKGCVYTVREVEVDPCGVEGFWLWEFPGSDWGDGFAAAQFIKVTPDKDMIERERRVPVPA